jgi:hypothetical protein
MTSRRARKSMDLQVPPWIQQLEHQDTADAVLRLALARRNPAARDVPPAQLAAIDRAADEAIRAIRKGKLRGARAARRAEAIGDRLSRAIDAAMVCCPICETRVQPSRLQFSPTELELLHKRPDVVREHLRKITREAVAAARAEERAHDKRAEDARANKIASVWPVITHEQIRKIEARALRNLRKRSRT